MQVNHFLKVNSLDIIWSSFLFVTLNKLLRKPALVVKSLSYLFWHCFATLSYKFTRCNLMGKSSSKYVFAKLLVKMQKKMFYQIFFSVINKEYRSWMFSRSCNFLRMILGWEQGEETAKLPEALAYHIF